MKYRLSLLLVSLITISALAHPTSDELALDDDDLLASSVQFDPQVSIQIRGDFRYIDANGIPNHDTGDFPNRGNPNSISPQNYHFRIPVSPTPNEKSTPNHFPNLIGIAINGVP